MRKTILFWYLTGTLVVALSVLVAVRYAPGRAPVDNSPRQSKPAEFEMMEAEVLVQLWEKAMSNPERADIEEALLQKRASSLPVLRRTVLVGSRNQKLLACSLLAEMRDTAAIKPLLGALEDRDERIRIRAVLSLGKIGDASAITPLRKMLGKNSLSNSLTKSIVVSLGRLDSREDIPIIRSCLSNSDESVRVNAAVALAMLGSTEGQELLLQSTRSFNPMVRKEATHSLGYLNTSKARNRLLEIINDPQGEWKSYAQISIAHQQLLGRAPWERVEYLSSMVKHENQRVAEWAIDRLGEIDDPESYALLKSISMEDSEIGHKAQRQLKARGIK